MDKEILHKHELTTVNDIAGSCIYCCMPVCFKCGWFDHEKGAYHWLCQEEEEIAKLEGRKSAAGMQQRLTKYSIIEELMEEKNGTY